METLLLVFQHHPQISEWLGTPAHRHYPFTFILLLQLSLHFLLHRPVWMSPVPHHPRNSQERLLERAHFLLLWFIFSPTLTLAAFPLYFLGEQRRGELHGQCPEASDNVHISIDLFCSLTPRSVLKLDLSSDIYSTVLIFWLFSKYIFSSI